MLCLQSLWYRKSRRFYEVYKRFLKDIQVSDIALGCMRIDNMSEAECSAYINIALECGYNFFDHADIYGGRYEEIFDSVLQSEKGLR